MKRLLASIFNSATALSAVFGIVVCALWVRSYRIAETWSTSSPNAFHAVKQCRGAVLLSEVRIVDGDFALQTSGWTRVAEGADRAASVWSPNWKYAGFLVE